MKRFVITLLTCLSLTVLSAQADKPNWAGQGGKPSASEKEQHVEEMRDKHGEKDKNKNKNKNKNKEKNKEKNKQGKHSDDSDWEKARKDLEDNVRANNRGMISNQPIN
jgi:hypothetical protein